MSDELVPDIFWRDVVECLINESISVECCEATYCYFDEEAKGIRHKLVGPFATNLEAAKAAYEGWVKTGKR